LFHFDLQILKETQKYVLEGYAAATGNIDLGGDRIEPGAFRNLEGLKQHGALLYAHRADRLPVAVIEQAQEDGYGLLVRCRFHGSTAAIEVAKMVEDRLRRGATVGLSIGYRTLVSEPARSPPAKRFLHEIQVLEVSLVLQPMNPLAQVNLVITPEGEEIRPVQTLSGADRARILDRRLANRRRSSF
jgi:HK97 family phage prohead protease